MLSRSEDDGLVEDMNRLLRDGRVRPLKRSVFRKENIVRSSSVELGATQKRMNPGEPIDERQPLDLEVLESAPIPIPGQTLCNTPFMALRTLGLSLIDGSARRSSQLPTIFFFFCLRHLSPFLDPSTILPPTVPASPLNHPVWMKVCVLIKRDCPLGMLAAKYISTVPAMMPPLE